MKGITKNDDDNNYKFCSVIDIITSIISVILLIITQVIDYFNDTIVNLFYITTKTRNIIISSSSSSSISLSLLLSLLKLLITSYNYFLILFISIIDNIIIILNKIRVMIMINNNDDNDNNLKSLADDAGITIDSINITTIDGYILGLHKCSKANSNKKSSSSSSSSSSNKPVVLLLHGLLQSSESFIIGGDLSLVSSLVNNGYDVWLGNTRGNKYSNKHVVFNEHERRFWNFSLDDYAKYDVPAMIIYISNYHSIKKLSIIGFSQGSAEVFASLSIYPQLNEYVNLFIALAPPIKPVGMSDNILSKMIHIYPNFTNVLFGFKSCFPYMQTIQKCVGLQLYTTMCTHAMKYLFGWSCSCISPKRRPLLFKSIFSSSSVKGVKHWFQMVRAKQLQIYNNDSDNEIYDNNKNKVTIDSNTKYDIDNSIKLLKKFYETKQLTHHYDLSNISCVVAVLAGAEDKLIDPYIVEKKVKNCIVTYIIKDYEHLDLLWADSAINDVFPKILTLLEKSSIRDD